MAEVPTFIADCHLGKLAKYLRFMGYDTLFFTHIEDNRLIQLANAQQRIILTRDRELSQRKNAPVFFLDPVDLDAQMHCMIHRFDLQERTSHSRRCLLCNVGLKQIDKTQIAHRLPENVRETREHFEYCPACNRLYWHGNHYEKMCVRVHGFFGTPNAPL